MKKFVITLLAVISFNSYAEFKEYKITVNTENDLVASVGVTYSATKKTFFCTELDMSDGTIQRVPKWKTVLYGQTDTGVIIVPKSLKGGCEYKQRTEANIHVSIPGRAEAYNTVYITDGDSSLGTQTIRCKEIQINNGNAIACDGNLQADRNGNLTVKIIKE